MTTVPVPYRVTAASAETADCVSLEVTPVGQALPGFAPGRFAMVYAFGVGEVPISVSAIGSGHRLVHTVRAIGAVTGALCRLRAGDAVGLRGPYGVGWDLDAAAGSDVLVVAGGIGLAPLRPVVRHVLGHPGHYGRLRVLIGTRAPEDLLYREELAHWRRAAAQVEVTVDRPDPGWRGSVGVVTTLLDRVDTRPDRTTALVCGPEVMIRHTARALLARGLPAHRIQVSLERNMRCGTGHCGHCQLGPLLLCRDGPVVGYHRTRSLLAVREL
ncbi:FAD/NAD(P)-binding protein [Streptomyces hygroscopicus]|uniref:FAD/NAD(P)-binding protein n=1 Tax=Streptomyces hygroscopicus TaxID=1912 RepID=UPI0004C733C4|nr:FAD/NAD(P)-binding protein [Streptomyces hygroscopicus]